MMCLVLYLAEVWFCHLQIVPATYNLPSQLPKCWFYRCMTYSSTQLTVKCPQNTHVGMLTHKTVLEMGPWWGYGGMLHACPQGQSNEEGKRARIVRSIKDRQEVEPAPTPTEELQATTPVTRKRKKHWGEESKVQEGSADRSSLSLWWGVGYISWDSNYCFFHCR